MSTTLTAKTTSATADINQHKIPISTLSFLKLVMPLFYIVEQHIYYAKALFDAFEQQVLEGVGYSTNGSFRLALFLKSNALEIDVNSDDTPQFLQFAKAYGEKAPRPVIAILWKRCNIPSKNDVLHALDPARIGTLYILPPRPGKYLSEYMPFVQTNFYVEKQAIISVRNFIITPADDDAKCINPFFEASETETTFLVAMIGSAFAFDNSDTYGGTFAKASKFHPTIVTITNAIRKVLFTPQDNIQSIGGVFETNYVSAEGGFYLGHIPLPSLITVGQKAYVLVTVLLNRKETIPSLISILDSISILKNYTDIYIIQVDINEDNQFIREFDLKLLRYNFFDPSEAALQKNKIGRQHLAICTKSSFDWVDTSKTKHYSDSIFRNGVIMHSSAEAKYLFEPEESINDLQARVDAYERRCRRFIADDDENAVFQNIIEEEMYDGNDFELSGNAKKSFVQ